MENKFKQGELVWDKTNRRVVEFVEQFDNGTSMIVVDSTFVVCMTSGIEPYSGQHKDFIGIRIHSGNTPPKYIQ